MAAPELSIFEASIQFIQTVGFPIFVAGWFMFRMEKKFDALTDVVLAVLRKR